MRSANGQVNPRRSKHDQVIISVRLGPLHTGRKGPGSSSLRNSAPKKRGSTATTGAKPLGHRTRGHSSTPARACCTGSSTMGGTLLWLCALTAVSWKVVSSQDSVYHNVALGYDVSSQTTSAVVTDGDQHTCLPIIWQATNILQVDLANSIDVYAVSILYNMTSIFSFSHVVSIHVGDTLDQLGSNNPKCQDIRMAYGSWMSTSNCGGMNGRYVTLNLGSFAACYICEIMVSATPLKVGTQVLMYGVASQSSEVEPGAGPWKALDSRAEIASAPTLCMTSGLGCSITDMDWEPWWRLDMLLLYRVKSVTIAGREDVQGLRLFGAEIRVGNSTTREDNSLCDQDIFVTSGQSAAFYCLPWLVGRFLIVALPGRIDSLGLCEVSLLANPMLKSSIVWKSGIISTSDPTTPN
uniref:Uncharacterized protein LOC116954681 n=1 Tax=Petromyzon marinus TaxID=7757 RepID=A0AAJ7UAJ3_PETMA|nr:uncharacterized protein LOC116954681 [Petromyzon marinus]